MSFNHQEFANIMVDDVLSKLDGTHPCFERFFDLEKPRRKFILGSLSDISKLNLGINSTSISNNSMSVKFLLEDINDNLIISPSLSVFYRVCPTLDEQMDFLENYHEKDSDDIQIAPIWKRKDIVFNDLNVEISSNTYSLSFENELKEINNDEVSFRKNVLSWDWLLTEEDFKSNVLTKNAPTLGWDCSIDLSLDEMLYNGKKYHLVEISMINTSEDIKTAETFLFNCNFSIFLGKNRIHPFTYEYEKNDFPSFYDSYLRSLNCHADYFESENKIQTQNFAKYKQIKYAPKTNIDGFELTFEDLSKENCIEKLEILYSLMKKHLDSCEYSLMDQEHSTAILSFKTSLSRFNEGIELLKSNPNALKAFNLMNKSFFNNAKGKYSSWRIFQIVFIVSNLSDVVNKTNNDLCDLLHVMTGGGKSETYFGLVIFSAFYDRIVGKLFGVTALTKFPLRMLSIQQLRRIADLFIWAEEIRLEEEIQGEPFSVAYFVGNSDEFPRYNIDIKNDILKASKKSIKIDGVIIDECPICGGHVYLSYDSSRELILHKCDECNRSFGLYFTDEEIFRMIPTFIVSTVDKLAGVSQQRRFKNILGGKLDSCLEGHGFIPRGDICEANHKQCKSHREPVNIDFDTGPSIIIQDEMHLIKEGFGTIDSHFESLLENLHYKFSGNKFKNISMSATVNGAKNQIKNLYHKSLLVFPVNLENKDGKDFFFEEFEDENGTVYQREIVGLKPNFRENNYAIILTMRYISEFIERVYDNLEFYSKKLCVDEETLLKNLLLYRNLLSYHNKKGDVHALNFFTRNLINESQTFNSYLIDPIILTGDNSLDEIKHIISKVSNFPQTEEDSEKMLLTSSTNIVSHGVDIDNWNIMLFQGIPRSTSEYIQALSRVGRKYFGVIFLWFYPNRVRDISFYQNFNEYHEILEFKVENVPLARWAKLGFKQTFTSIFNAAVLNYISDQFEVPIYTVDTFNNIFATENNQKLLIDFIKQSYISDSEMLGSEYFDENIEKETLERIKYLSEYTGANKSFFPKALAENDNMYYKTQLGMRGIQDTVLLSPFWADTQYLTKGGFYE